MDFNALRSRLFGFGQDVLNVAFDQVTGVMIAQTGDAINGVTGASNVEIWQPWGLVSNPGVATPGSSAAQGLLVHGGDRDILIAGRDLRTANSFGNCPPGRTVLFSSTSAAKVVVSEDGSVTMFTTDSGQLGGNGVMCRLAPDGFTVLGPWGALVLDGTGFHVTTHGGPTLDMGGVGGLPGPFAALGSSFVVSGCGVCQLDAANVALGPALSPTGYQSVVYGLTVNPLCQPLTPLGIAALESDGVFCSSSVYVAF